MAFDFPNSPTVGQTWPTTPVSGQPVYTWDGEKWTSGAAFGPIYVNDNPPAAPPGSLWWESDTGILYVNYYDGNSTQWVAIAGLTPGTVRYDSAQSLTSAQQVQARQNIYAAPFDALAYSGVQINGGFDVSQELGSAGTVGPATYVCDGWKMGTGGAVSLAMTFAEGLSGGISGYPNLIYYTVQTAKAALAAGDNINLQQSIEGYRIARLAWGTANAQPLTVCFWTMHARTGIYSISVRNGGGTRSYVATYTQNAASTPQFNVITIPGCTDGTWALDNTTGILFNFGFGCGTTFAAPSNNAWLAGNYVQSASQVNAVAATSDVGRIYGVVVLPGIEAPSAVRAPFIMRPFDQELILCKRYYRKIGGQVSVDVLQQGYANTGSAMGTTIALEPAMRAAPSISEFGTFSKANVASTVYIASTNSFIWQLNATVTGPLQSFGNIGGLICDARL
jgi:hypothetical protein